MLQTFAGRCIYESESGTRVFDNGLYRWLMFKSNAIQTLLFKSAPHSRGLRYVAPLTLMVRALPGNACLLGLGGAGAAHAITHASSQHKLTVVELNAEVIDIARQFFKADDIPNMEVIEAEASAFIQSCNESFAHILVDVFDAFSFPDSCNNLRFFSHCKDRLSAEGVLAINMANQSDHRSVYELIQKLFPGKTITIPVTGRENLIILAFNGPDIERYLDVIRQQKNIRKLHWSPAWGCVAEMK